MKIARTFTIDYHLYQELRKKPNQSRIVERAVRAYLNGSEEYSVAELPIRNLMAALHAREDTPNAIKLLIHDYLTSS